MSNGLINPMSLQIINKLHSTNPKPNLWSNIISPVSPVQYCKTTRPVQEGQATELPLQANLSYPMRSGYASMSMSLRCEIGKPYDILAHPVPVTASGLWSCHCNWLNHKDPVDHLVV